jgi:hypothetical protein
MDENVWLSSFVHAIWAEVIDMTDPDLATVKGMGFDMVVCNAVLAELDRCQAADLKGIVWLGKYYDDNDIDGPQCTFQKSDAEITTLVNLVKNHPAVAYYFLDDEPHELCPNVRQQFLDRNALVKSLDPNHPTLVSENRTSAFATLANVSDILIAIAYPCNVTDGCTSTNIPERLTALQAAGVNRFWAIRQTFNETGATPYYIYPGAADYAAQSAQWDNSACEGELAFMGYGVYAGADGIELAPQALKDAVVAANARR